MEYIIKLLSQNGLIFFPLTSAEAVIVKDNSNGEDNIITLDKVLNKKLENVITPIGSGLNSYKLEKNVIITHSNSIKANEFASPNLIKYDNRGHIIEVAPFGSILVKVNLNEYTKYNGLTDKELLMGDDFGIDLNNNIILKWTNI